MIDSDAQLRREAYIQEQFAPRDNIWVAPSFAYIVLKKARELETESELELLCDAFVGMAVRTPWEEENLELTIGSLSIGLEHVTVEFVEQEKEHVIYPVGHDNSSLGILYYFKIVTGREAEWENHRKTNSLVV